jgi:serine/threonine-protein kinase 24/25/MST4
MVGTPSWMAPEVCSQEGHDDKADVWSLGITAIEMAMGQVPYYDMQPVDVIKQILNNEPPQLKGDNWSEDFKDFIKQLLTKRPKERPSA